VAAAFQSNAFQNTAFESASGTNGTATVIGVQSASAVATITANGAANRTVSGIQAASAAATVTASGTVSATATVTGAQATSTAATITAAGGISATATVTGTAAASAAATITATGGASKTVIGQQAASASATIVATGDASRSVTGLQAASAAATISALAGATGTATGVSSTSQAAAIAAQGGATATATGVQAASDAATVTITGSNPYKFAVTLPSLTAGQRVDMYIAATIDTIATAGIVASAQADTVLLSDGVTLADDAITASKFDESTAFPLKSADTGSTQVARVGADGDTLETLSDEIAAVKAETAAILDDTGTTGVLLSTSALGSIFDDEVIVGTYTFSDLLKIMASALAGKATGGGTTAVTFRGVDDTSDVIVATVDANGNRSAVTLTV